MYGAIPPETLIEITPSFPCGQETFDEFTEDMFKGSVKDISSIAKSLPPPPALIVDNSIRTYFVVPATPVGIKV